MHCDADYAFLLQLEMQFADDPVERSFGWSISAAGHRLHPFADAANTGREEEYLRRSSCHRLVQGRAHQRPESLQPSQWGDGVNLKMLPHRSRRGFEHRFHHICMTD